MFENIIGQNDVVDFLKNDILNGYLTNSMLFYGENSTGKLTTAIEIAKILNCKSLKESECECANCIRINEFEFNGLIILTRRDFYYQIKAYIDSYNNSGDFKFLINIKKIIKLLYNANQDFLIADVLSENEKKQINVSFEYFTEFIYSKKHSQSDFKKLLTNVENLNKIFKQPNIPVNTIRALLDWSYITQKDTNKVVIIDHFELLEKSSQNILLKRIEEPSENLYFILLTENINKILPTIKSRCRRYFFKRHKEENIKNILDKNFGIKESTFSTIKDFLLDKDEISHENVINIIHKLINILFIKEANFSDLVFFFESYNNKKIVKAVLIEFIKIIDNEILYRHKKFYDADDFKILNKISNQNILLLKNIINDKINKFDTFNLNPLLLLEGIFYPIKLMVQNDQI